MTPAPTLAVLSRGRDNNLTLLRLLAAAAVVYGHAFGMNGQTTTEPFYRAFGLGTGDVGVDAFFVISGFLVAKSFAGKDLLHFAWARVMRIFPALWVSSLLLVAIAGLAFSPLPAGEFWLRPDTLIYLAKNASMLPGIGAQTHLPFAFGPTATTSFNESLWTLPHELQMYLLLAVLGLCGALRWRLAFVAVAVAGGIAFVGDILGAFHLMDADRARFVFLFFAGTSAYAWRDHVQLRGALFGGCLAACIAAAVATRNHAIHVLVLTAALPYLTLWLSFVPGGLIRRFNRVGDYSYGTYIYAGPIQALIVARIDHWPPLANFALTLLIVIPLAAASWHLLESRALAIPLPSGRARLGARVARPSEA
jgi:peptidoglycan/LPS O-acetylase OafA/YrhL